MNTKSARIHAKYDKLENLERIQLIANAIERRDNVELEVLISTTPRKTYSMPDAWIMDRYDAITRISTTFWLIIESLLRERNQKQLIKYILKSYPARLAPKKEDDSARKDRTEYIKEIQEQFDVCECLLWAVSEAIHLLAKSTNLKSTELIAYTPGEVRENLARGRPQCEDQESEECLDWMVQSYFQLFASYWPELYTTSDCVSTKARCG